ncbi:helix-turn-helix domain-containing protein [Streptomyces sp. 15-116A]|uniref:helix-turn-helix domain-containing protein n=1 Tax=Streptomyces sp. 15-116A TaxID=2259035 RepID=UPI0021B1AC59|nr:helix-turn-helix domain-containing protein [Streptomyces sp. 15-116A]MCT7355702.1 helix-turn-helix domain-containing protein [Streptomyces sp. 15-116A]
MKRSPATPLPAPKERRRLREAASLTPTQLARRLGVRSDTVRAWESGRTTPRGRNRETYAKLLASLERGEAPHDGDNAGEDEGMVTVCLEKLTDDTAHRAVAPEPARFAQTPPDDRCYLTPAQAFDALYAFCAPALVRQTYLLTGRRELARESVERAFQLAWERWPEVARDPEPAGWVRAAAYEWALSPWHRFRPRHRTPEPPPADSSDRALLDALLHLPPPQRRTLLLYDGVGLDLPETAAETEASTPSAARRLLHAREAVAARLPELSDPELLHERLAEVASAERLRPARPDEVRSGSERRARFWTRSAIAFTVALIGTTALTLFTAPTHYEPPVPPGETVQGVPPRVAPGPLSEKERELRSKLREELLHGPERLAPHAG